MVWANTSHIGCGQTTFKGNRGFVVKYLVCNYAYAGNFLGRRMYEVGSPCSKCKHGCSKNFPGLCSESVSLMQLCRTLLLMH